MIGWYLYDANNLVGTIMSMMDWYDVRCYGLEC